MFRTVYIVNMQSHEYEFKKLDRQKTPFVRWWEQTLHFHCYDGSLCPFDASHLIHHYTWLQLWAMADIILLGDHSLVACCLCCCLFHSRFGEHSLIKATPLSRQESWCCWFKSLIWCFLIFCSCAALHNHATLTFAAAFSLVPLCWLENCTCPAMSWPPRESQPAHSKPRV